MTTKKESVDKTENLGAEVKTPKSEAKGIFKSSLVRNFGAMRQARAENIFEDTVLEYDTELRKMVIAINKCDRRIQERIDALSPTTAGDGNVGKGFDATVFMTENIQTRADRRELAIKLQLLVNDYEYLLGAVPTKNDILAVCPEIEFKY